MRFSSRRVFSALLGIAAVVAVAVVLAQGDQPAQANTSGPNNSGYRWVDSKQPAPTIPFNFVDISATGVPLVTISDADDDFTVVTLPFPFTFFGTAYTEAAVSTNGYLSFTTTGEDSGCNENYNNGEGDLGLSIPQESCAGGAWPANPLIGAWIDDLDTAECGSILTATQGTAPNRRFIVQWNDVCHFDCETCETGFGVTFEIILLEGTNDVLVQYLDTFFESGEDSDITQENQGGTTTTGINRDATTGLQYSLNTPALSSGLAVCYTSTTAGAACGLSTGTPTPCLARGGFCPSATPSATAPSTPTPLSPGATSTPTPTATPTMTPVASATPTATSTPSPTPTTVTCGLLRGSPPCTTTPTPTATPTQVIIGTGNNPASLPGSRLGR